MTVKLSPELKFASVLDAKLLDIGADIDYHQDFRLTRKTVSVEMINRREYIE